MSLEVVRTFVLNVVTLRPCFVREVEKEYMVVAVSLYLLFSSNHGLGFNECEGFGLELRSYITARLFSIQFSQLVLFIRIKVVWNMRIEALERERKDT
mgnify:CR=1 FL=1